MRTLYTSRKIGRQYQYIEIYENIVDNIKILKYSLRETRNSCTLERRKDNYERRPIRTTRRNLRRN